jgi:hypothetical protein
MHVLTSMDLDMHLPPQSLLQPGQDIQIASDIDWVSLLSGPSIFGDQSLAAESTGGAKNGRTKHNRNASRTKKAIPPKIAFHTKSPDNILDDGYRWRKYGQKAVKNSIHPRFCSFCPILFQNIN